MRSPRAKKLLAALTLVSVVAVAGCSAGAGAGDSDGKSFTFWSFWNQNEPAAIVLADAIADFEEDTGIRVDVQWQGRQNVSKLLPTLNGGAAADLVDNSINGLGPITSSGQQLDLTKTYAQIVPGDGKPISEVIPEPYIDGVTNEDGVPEMVPYAVLSEAIWFDASKYPQLAVPADDWDSFISKLSSIGSSGTPAVSIASNDAYWIVILLVRSLGVDGVRSLATDKTGEAWSQPGVKKALDAFDKLRPFFPDGYAANQVADAETLWAGGGAATFLGNTSVPNEAAPNVPAGFTFDSIQVPPLTKGGSTDVGENFVGFSIPATAKNADAASQFVAYFMQKEYAQRIATDAIQISVRNDVEVPDQLRSVSEALTSNELYADKAGLSADFPDWYSTVFSPVMANFVTGQSDASTFISEGKRQTVDYLAANG